MKHYKALLCLSFLFVAGLTFSLQGQDVGQTSGQPKPQIQNQKQDFVPANLGINNRRKGPVKIGAPVSFKTKEGKKAWKVVIPGNRPLATPAVVDGKVYVGGGFGSFEFYALDAKTGKQVWQYRTGDDGPTAAVVSDGYIAFNTESCELEVVSIKGKRIWKKWLGDPLMSMPAINNGKVFMAFPNSRGDRKHYLACFDLKTGKEHWRKVIPGDIITAPVIEDNQIYVSTLEGTVTCFNETSGKVVWQDKKNATSSVAVYKGKCYFSQREATKIKGKDGKLIVQQMESLALRPVAVGGKIVKLSETSRKADYLDFKKRTVHSSLEDANKKIDGTVGFASAPAAAKLYQANKNLGVGTVCSVWSYQGSRPFFYKGNLVSSMGDELKCVDPKTKKLLWSTKIESKSKTKILVDSHLTPPAIVNGKMFLGTSTGEVLCMNAESGKLLWKATVGEPILFQPAVMNGHVYVSSSTGSVFCVETGDANDTGWAMWGGNPCHNGVVEQ